MTIRTRLLILSLAVGLSIVAITFLFASALSSLVKIDAEKGHLTTLSQSVLNLSIVVNSLDSAQYRNVNKKLQDALAQSDKAFDDLKQVVILPVMSDDLKKAFEVIGNMRALMTDDLKSLNAQFAALQPDLEKYFLESNSTTIRMFYTNDRIRSKNDLKDVFARIDGLITSINGLTETLAGVSDTIQSQAQVIDDETAKIRDLSLWEALMVSALILLAVVLMSLLLGNSISRRVKEMQRKMVPVSQGDFSLYLPVRGADEVAGITVTVNALLDSLNRLLRQVQSQVEGLKGLGADLTSQMGETMSAVGYIESNIESSHQQLAEQTRAVTDSVVSARNLGGSTDHLSQAFQSQLQILASSSAGIEQIIANIGSVNANAVRAEDTSRILEDISREGQVKLDLVVRAVHEIARSSANLVQVTAVLDDIADQTNLLAMNASIEAAHAGASGRGFAVVANEIRKLAEQAGSQAKEISRDLQVVNQNIREIDTATSVAVGVFQKVVTQSVLVSTIVREVQSSMDEQNKGGRLVLEGLLQLNQINDQVGAAVADLKRGEQEILERIQDLARQNTQVNEHNEEVRQRTRDISLIVDRTTALADTTRKQIESLEGETNQFKTRDLALAEIPA